MDKDKEIEKEKAQDTSASKKLDKAVLKQKGRKALELVVKNSKVVFPFLAGVAVAVTVITALGAVGAKKDKMDELGLQNPVSAEELQPQPEPEEVGDIPLTANRDQAIATIISDYFDALAQGDEQTLRKLCDVIEDDKMMEITELAKYVESYDDFQIYTKPGLGDGNYVAYVCYKMYFTGKESGYPGYRTLYVSTDTSGSKYLKFAIDDEENDYIVQISGQADVVDMNNKIAVEYNDLMSEQPELLRYLNEVHNEVQVAMGVNYSQQVAGDDGEESPQESAGGEDAQTPEEGEQPEAPVEVYAKAISTVNVRASDSQLSDKVGKVSAGTKLRVLEQLVNGWSKVLYEDKEAYIKSEFLNVIQDAAGAEVIGTITAESNVNVRISPSETAERLGILTGGDTADLLGRENGWCKINYQGKIGYVKEDFVK